MVCHVGYLFYGRHLLYTARHISWAMYLHYKDSDSDSDSDHVHYLPLHASSILKHPPHHVCKMEKLQIRQHQIETGH